MSGVCRLAIRSATLEDSDEYTCKINKQADKTETVLTIVGRFYLKKITIFQLQFFISNFV